MKRDPLLSTVSDALLRCRPWMRAILGKTDSAPEREQAAGLIVRALFDQGFRIVPPPKVPRP